MGERASQNAWPSKDPYLMMVRTGHEKAGPDPPAHRPQDQRPRVALEFVSRTLNPFICCAALPVVGKGGSRKKQHVFAIRSVWWAGQEE